MKIITVYFDDYKPIPVGVMAVNDEDVESVVRRLDEANTDKEAYKVKVEEPDSVELVIAHLQDLLGEEHDTTD